MSELSRTVQVGTSQVANAYEGLVNLHAVNRERKAKAMAGIGDSLAELGATFREYGSWKAAKQAEDESAEVADAYALGMQTGDPSKALVTLGAVRPKTYKAAVLRSKYVADAMGQAADRNKAKLDEAENFARQQRYAEELKNTKELTKIRQAELELEKSKEKRIAAEPPTPRNIDPLSKEGITAEEERARRVAEAKAKVEAANPNAPSELDKPYPPSVQALFEEKAGLKKGALKDVTRRDVEDLLDLDPDRNAIRALNLAAKQRQNADYEPKALKDARKALAKAESELSDFKDKMALTPPFTKAPAEVRQKELETAVKKAQEGVDQAETVTPPATDQNAPPPGADDLEFDPATGTYKMKGGK